MDDGQPFPVLFRGENGGKVVFLPVLGVGSYAEQFVQRVALYLYGVRLEKFDLR